MGDTTYYSNIRYTVFNHGQANAYDEYPNGNQGRCDFAVHEDTNKNCRGGHIENTVPGNIAPGSAGCIALVPGGMIDFDAFVQAYIANRAHANWTNSYSGAAASMISVFVLHNADEPTSCVNEFISTKTLIEGDLAN